MMVDISAGGKGRKLRVGREELNKFSEAVEAVRWIRTNGPFCGMSKQVEEESHKGEVHCSLWQTC